MKGRLSRRTFARGALAAAVVAVVVAGCGDSTVDPWENCSGLVVRLAAGVAWEDLLTVQHDVIPPIRESTVRYLSTSDSYLLAFPCPYADDYPGGRAAYLADLGALPEVESAEFLGEAWPL